MSEPDPVTGTTVGPRGFQRSISLERIDGWINALSGMGMPGRDKTVGTTFQCDPVDSETALQIWRGDDIGARIVETLPDESLREGYELCIGDDEPPDTFKPEEPAAPLGTALGSGAKPGPARVSKADAWGKRHPSAYQQRVRVAISRAQQSARRDAGDAKPLQEAISKKFEKLGLNAAIKEAMCYERAGGGGAVLLGANDFTTDLRQPLNLKRVRSFDWVTPLEARELQPIYWYNNPRAPKFGHPAVYQLIPYAVGAPIDGYLPQITQIHETRLLVFPGARVSRRILQNGTFGWGDSVFTRIAKALANFNTGYSNAGILLSDFAQAIYKIKGLAEVLAQDGANSLSERMLAVELSRSIARAVIIDSEEDFERKSTTMAGYPETLDRLGLRLAAAAGMPYTRMMGQSPAGMNATGESDTRFFYDSISSLQTQKVAPALLRCAEIELAVLGEDPETVNRSVKFKALWQPTEKEIAEAHFAQANADAIYLDREVVSPEEMALSRFGGDQYSYETRVDFEARASQEAVVAPTVEAKPDAPPPIPGAVDPTAPDPKQPGPPPSSKPPE